MPFNVNRQDEDGRVLETLMGVDVLLPSFSDESFHCLRFIDEYGNTTFNGLQIQHQFLPEWKRMYDRVNTEQERRGLQAIEDLARRCLDDVHVYLKFIGD
jgi:hypothetical protein